MKFYTAHHAARHGLHTCSIFQKPVYIAKKADFIPRVYNLTYTEYYLVVLRIVAWRRLLT